MWVNVLKIYCCALSQWCSGCESLNEMELNEWLWQVSGWCGLGCSQCSTEAAWQRFVCLTGFASSQWPAAGSYKTSAHLSPICTHSPFVRQYLPNSITSVHFLARLLSILLNVIYSWWVVVFKEGGRLIRLVKYYLPIMFSRTHTTFIPCLRQMLGKFVPCVKKGNPRNIKLGVSITIKCPLFSVVKRRDLNARQSQAQTWAGKVVGWERGRGRIVALRHEEGICQGWHQAKVKHQKISRHQSKGVSVCS